MASIRALAPPESALHRRYAVDNGHVDCYTTHILRRVSLAEFVEAFYTSWLFRIERLILRCCVAKPSTDEEARQLARAERDTFAAWKVEARADQQLLMCDYLGKTRSWLMVEPGEESGGPFTRLYFGSAIVAARDPASGLLRLGFTFRALLPFHRVYSRALLRAACARLESHRF